MDRFGGSRVLPGVVPIPSGIPPFFFRARSRRRSCQRFAKTKGDEIEHGRGKRSDPLVASRLLAGGGRPEAGRAASRSGTGLFLVGAGKRV